jgi:hypothetical protein
MSLGHHEEPCSEVVSPTPERDATGQLVQELVVPGYGDGNWAEEVNKESGHIIQGEYTDTYSQHQPRPLLLPGTPNHPLHRTTRPPGPTPHYLAPDTHPHALATHPNAPVSTPIPHRYQNEALVSKTNGVT